MKLTWLSLVLACSIASASATENSPEFKKGNTMTISHVHAAVADLPAALRWLDRVWDVRPTFQNDKMASVPFGEMTIIIDASPADTPMTVGFDSRNCDADFQRVTSRGGVALEEPA